MTSISKSIKPWFRPQRLFPLLTILGAGSALVLNIIGVIKLSIADGIIISLLALLAVDSIVERLQILEKIEKKLSDTFNGKVLRSRTEFIDFEERSRHASEIYILAISAISMSGRFAHVFEKRIKAGCKIRIILLDPSCESLKALELTNRDQAAAHDIKAALAAFLPLTYIKSRRGKCEIHLSDFFLPFSLVCINPTKESGEMIIEYHSYKEPFGEQPHIILTKQNNAHWFEFYFKQFEKAWNDTTIWNPNNT